MNALNSYPTASSTGFPADSGASSAPPFTPSAGSPPANESQSRSVGDGSASASPMLPGGMRDRRQSRRSGHSFGSGSRRSAHSERRQFGDSYNGLSEEGRELAAAIDGYKMRHHRRYITCDEMLAVLHQLGYTKAAG